MYSTCNLFAYSLLTFVTFVSHVLTGALPNVVSESKFEALGRGYDCSYSSGVFMSNVITGECPAGVTSDGKSSIDVYCGADDQYSDTDRCEQAKAEVAGTSLAIICYGILLVLSLFVFCMGGRRASKRAFYLLFVVSLLGLVFATVSLIVFQDRTKDEVDDYGCSETTIDWLQIEGKECFVRGPAYFFARIALGLNIVHLGLLLSSACKLQEDSLPSVSRGKSGFSKF